MTRPDDDPIYAAIAHYEAEARKLRDDAFTQAVRRAHVRPKPRASWWVIPATLLGVIAWCAITATITIGPEAWWTAYNKAAVEAGE